jgi:glycosyltransferase involved in cell wall biosynthesis
MKKISVIITTYNSENTIKRALNSVLNQNGLNKKFSLEIIVIDDCSTDSTTKILKNKNIDFISTNKNSGGPNKGRNIGLKKATGEYICIMDHDDEWAIDKLELQLEMADKTPIVTSGFTIINEITNKKNNFINLSKDSSGFIFYEKNETFLNKLSKSNKGQYSYSGSILFHNRLKNILFEEEYGMIDFDRRLKLFENNTSAEVCKSLYNRYVQSTNLSLNENYRQIDFDYSLKVLEQYRSKYPKEVAIAIKRVHGTRARYFYLVGKMNEARKYFLKSPINPKTILYYLTSYWGHEIVRKKFSVLK